MGFWDIIVPEAEVNLVTNPSIETVTTGFTAVGGSISRVSTQSRRGSYSLQITPTASGTDGAYFGTVSLTVGNTYLFAVDVLGVNGIPYRIYFGTTGGTVLGTPTTFTGTGKWQRIYVLYTESATNSRRLYLVKNASGSTGAFYADGWHCSQKSYLTTYVDGDQAGCNWTGARHISTSQRSSLSRAGGRIYNLGDLNGYVLDSPGIGIPPVTHRVLTHPFMPGANYRGQRIEERPFTLIFTAMGTSYSNLHAVRKTLIDYIQADGSPNEQPVVLRYTGSNSDKPVLISCYYESGLERQRPEGFSEDIALRLRAYDPFWYEDGEQSYALTTEKDLSTAYIARKVDGDWLALGTGMNGLVQSIAVDRSRGRVYVGGNFTTGNSVTLNRVGYWNGTTFVAMDSGVGGQVNNLLVAPNGDVWVAGYFTTVGSGAAAAKGLARWNVSSGTWTAFNPSTATFSYVNGLAIDKSGNLYIGGDFTNWNGLANGDYIAKYDGSTWTALGTGMNGAVIEIACHPNGDVYATGAFTTGDGVSLNYVGYWNGTTFVAMGPTGGAGSPGLSGGTTVGRTVLVGRRGEVYVGGEFTTAGNISASNIAVWNGSLFSPLGVGTNNDVYNLHMAEDGTLYASGAFTSAGGLTLADTMAGWNGTSWFHLGLDLFSTPTVYTGVVPDGDDLYIGFSLTGTSSVANLQTISNPGTSRTYPIFEFTWVSGGTSWTLQWIKNETTGRILYCNYDLLIGETLTIDLTPGRRKITSSFRGNVFGEVFLRNSDFSDFFLLPGNNSISVFANSIGVVTYTAFLRASIPHISASGVAL